MNSVPAMGRVLVIVGLVIALSGAALSVLARLGAWRLPGDIVVLRHNLVVYFPIASALSLVLTLVLNLLFRK